MHRLRRQSSVARALWLATVLVFVQTATLTHAVAHDAASPPGQLCALCIAAHATEHGCPSNSVEMLLQPIAGPALATLIAKAPTVALPQPHQRGPPSIL